MTNAEYTFTITGKMLVRSTVPITKGSKITINYAANPLLGTMERLKLLETTRFLGSCDCQRCKDPTELGSFTSGIFCTKCPNHEGILLPEYPLEKDQTGFATSARQRSHAHLSPSCWTKMWSSWTIEIARKARNVRPSSANMRIRSFILIITCWLISDCSIVWAPL